MAIYNEDIIDVELTGGNIYRSFMNKTIGEGDIKANRFGVRVLRNGTVVNLDGCTCMGYFIRADGGTIPITGIVSGATAYVTLIDTCYAVEGKFALAIKLIGESVTGTMRIVDGVVENTTTGTTIDPGTIIPSIETLIAEIEAAVDSIPSDYSALSADVKKLDEGAEVSIPFTKQPIVNKTGYYDENGFNSASGFVSAEYACTAGDVIKITASGNPWYAGYYFYDSNYNFVAESEKDIVFDDYEVTVPANATKLGLNKLNGTSESVSAIIVKKSQSSEYNAWKAGHSWNELVEIDNLSGVWVNNDSFKKNGDGVSGYVTKVYDVTDVTLVQLSGTMFGAMGEKKDGSHYWFGEYEQTIDMTEYVRLYVGGLAENFWDSVNYIRAKAFTKFTSKWENRKIVWFGTSIPAGGYIGAYQPLSYPFQVGKILGANVYNEAVGSSGVHCRELNRVSATNPYGFNPYFEPVSRCLTNTVAMMQWIGNWADYYCNGGTYQNPEAWDSSIFTSGLPSSWTSANTDAIKQFSYENKLDKYLTNDSFPDLFVFDHGYNDRIKYADATGTYEQQLAQYGRDNCYTFRGAMNFLIDRILSFNPWARIIMIGDYENQSSEKRDDSTYQMRVAEDYEIPIFKRWEYTGWSQVQKTSHYDWINGLLYYTPNETKTKTCLAWNLSDGVHPHSDRTGRATRIMARLIAPFIDNLD